MTRPIGLVLAGGLGSRLGRAKGDLVLGGRPLAERAAAVLGPLCRGVLISLRAGSANPAPGIPAVEDAPPAGRGPLAGILAAFEATADRDLLVLACDYPGVCGELLERLVESAEPADALVFPVDASGRDHPLVGLWRRRTHAGVRSALDRGRHRVADVVSELGARRVDARRLGVEDAERALANVNRPEDLDEALERES